MDNREVRAFELSPTPPSVQQYPGTKPPATPAATTAIGPPRPTCRRSVPRRCCPSGPGRSRRRSKSGGARCLERRGGSERRRRSRRRRTDLYIVESMEIVTPLPDSKRPQMVYWSFLGHTSPKTQNPAESDPKIAFLGPKTPIIDPFGTHFRLLPRPIFWISDISDEKCTPPKVPSLAGDGVIRDISRCVRR